MSPQSPAIEAGPLFPVKDHGKWGYMDSTGKLVISPTYYDAYPFSEGLALVQPLVDMENRAIIRVQFIDKSGKMVGSKHYAYAEAFSQGLALVVIAGEEKWGPGYIDSTGKMVIPQNQYKHAKSFSEGLAAVEDVGKWGYLDKTGKMVIAPQFAEAYRFTTGLAAVKDGGKWGYIDTTGKVVIAPQHEVAYHTRAGRRSGGKGAGARARRATPQRLAAGDPRRAEWPRRACPRELPTPRGAAGAGSGRTDDHQPTVLRCLWIL